MANAPTISEKPEPKRIALFLDGTWNVVDDNTNVWRMKSLCAPIGSDGRKQAVYYNVGVGTSFGEKLKGGMFGYGLDENVIHAYEWLIDTYNPEDEIFIFGFSRGAYTARSLAGLIAKCGLLIPGAALGVKQLYSRYRLGPEPRTIWKLNADRQDGHAAQLPIEEQWLLKYSMPVRIKMVGVWDTVGALGIPAFHIPGISRSSFGFLHTGLRIPIEHGFHALAIDEHRQTFSPTLWTKITHKTAGVIDAAPRPIGSVEQRWFAGAHGNVGGGYQNDLLAQIPLRWMMQKASQLGLAFRSQVTLDGDAAQSPIADSFKEFMYGAYRVLKFGRPYYRPLGSAPLETADASESNVNETIDASVFDRWRRVSAYRPKNLSDWAAARGVDVTTLHHSVRADDPNVSAPD